MVEGVDLTRHKFEFFSAYPWGTRGFGKKYYYSKT
jgi:hypothetical protein